jgi:hypothetical protein
MKAAAELFCCHRNTICVIWKRWKASQGDSNGLRGVENRMKGRKQLGKFRY